MVVHFSPKILRLNIGQFGTVVNSPRHSLSIGFDPGTGVFELCNVFGVWVVFGQILEMENELNRDWFRGVLRSYGTLWT